MSNRVSTRNVLAATIGAGIEWFDILVYAYLATTLAQIFFPETDPGVGVILTFGMFGASYVARPIGGIFIGIYADRAGRRAAMVLVSTLMFLGTAIIAFLPGYDRIGWVAPLILMIARLIQGFSAGGEFGSATAYLAEQSAERRGFYASLQFSSQGFAMVTAAGLTAALTHFLSVEQMLAWGWRVPFFIGLLIGPVAYYIREHVTESPEFLEARKAASAGASAPTALPSVQQILISTALIAVASAVIYFLIFLPTYSMTVLKLGSGASLVQAVMVGVLLMIVPPISGTLGDRWGYYRIAIPAVALCCILPLPLLEFVHAAPSQGRMLLLQLLLGAAITVYFGILPALLTSAFPTHLRTTAVSLSYNLAVVLVGGFGPTVLSYLAANDASTASLGVYPSFIALLSLIGLIVAARRDRKAARQRVQL